MSKSFMDGFLDWLESTTREERLRTWRGGFKCQRCGMVSANSDDLREGYCGNCHDWTGKVSNGR